MLANVNKPLTITAVQLMSSQFADFMTLLYLCCWYIPTEVTAQQKLRSPALRVDIMENIDSCKELD